MQRGLAEEREGLIQATVTQEGVTDLPFTSYELEAALRKKTDTALGADMVTYSMLFHLGSSGQANLLDLINTSLAEGKLPQKQKTVVIHPIPNPKNPGAMRPISLLSCLGKVMERMVFSRWVWKVGPLPPSFSAYLLNTGATDCSMTFVGTLRRRRGLAIFLDLEKAFELAGSTVILATVARKGVQGKLLRWVQSFLTDRGACVRSQSFLSSRHAHIHGTPQGCILSSFLFNIIMEGLLDV